MEKRIFSFYSPHSLPLKGILSIPHSGEWIPNEFLPYLEKNRRDLDQDLDYKVNELVDIEALTSLGVAVIVSHVHRVCVDLNRDPSTAVFAWPENTQGKTIVLKKPAPLIQENMLHRYHAPYFELLQSLIHEGVKDRKERLPFIDLHSMPSRPTEYHLKKNPNQSLERKNFCISDVKGTSCEKSYLDHAVKLFSMNHSVTVNDPYFGGYVTQFTKTLPMVNALQVEINRGIYMDEQKLELKESETQKLKPHLTSYLKEIFN